MHLYRGVFIVGASGQANIKRLIQFQLHRAAREVEFFAGSGDHQVYIVAEFRQGQMRWAGYGGDDLARDGAFFLAPLQRRHSVAMNYGVDVIGIRVQRSADHERGFAMRISGRRHDGNVGRDTDPIGIDLFPDEVEIVFRGPHVVATGGHEDSPVDKARRTCVQNRTYIRLAIEKTDSLLRREGERNEQQHEE